MLKNSSRALNIESILFSRPFYLSSNERLLKLSPQFFEEVIAFGQQAGDSELVNLAFTLSRTFRVDISLGGFRSLIDSLYQSKVKGGEKKESRPTSVLVNNLGQTFVLIFPGNRTKI